MATVSAGSTASYTLTAADSISITIDSGTESANVRVTNGSTASIYSEVINRSKIIGPFPSGAVMSITAIGGDVVYEQVDQEGARDFTQTEKTSLQAMASEYGILRSLPTVGWLGDSRTQFAVNNISPITQWTNWSYIGWVLAAMRGRINTSQSLVFGVAGQKTDHFLNTQVPAAIAAGVNIAVCLIGINDCMSGVPLATAVGNATAGITALTNAGIRVVWIPEIPLGPTGATYVLTSAQEQWIAQYNTAISALFSSTVKRGIFVGGVLESMTDFATGQAIANALHDGLHASALGAQMMAGPVITALQSICPAMGYPQTMLNDVYDATANPGGNLLTNGLLAGTGGTVVNGGSGTAPDGWIVGGDGAVGTLSVATSSVSDATRTGLKRCRQTFGGTANGVSGKVDQTVANSAWLVPGNRVVLEAACEFSSLVAMWGPWIRLSVISGGTTYESQAHGYSTVKGSSAVASGGVLWFRTEPIVIPSSPSALRARLMCTSKSSGSAAGQVDWMFASMRYVP